jgi:hypothetical protein
MDHLALGHTFLVLKNIEAGVTVGDIFFLDFLTHFSRF